MNNKIIVGLFVFLFLFSFVSAAQEPQKNLGTFPQYKDIKLLQICGTCTYNTITSIVYPNSTHNIIDINMTRRGAEYNYTFSQTDLLGIYSVNGVGDLDGTANAWAYEFEVTTTGGIQQNLLNNAIILLMFGLSLTLFLVGVWKGNYSIGFLSGISFVLTGMYAMIYGFANITNLYTQATGGIIIGWGVIILLTSAFEGLSD